MSSLRDMLKAIPQDAEFHPEGNVWTHTRAVRRSLDEAIALLPQFQITPADRNLLRLAAWCHDLGKVHATVFRDGRWVAPGHEKSKYLNIALRRLDRRCQTIWNRSSLADRRAFLFVCTRHMAVSDQSGIDAKVMRSIHSMHMEQSRRGRLAVVLMVMDRLGTTRPTRVADAMMVSRFASR